MILFYHMRRLILLSILVLGLAGSVYAIQPLFSLVFSEFENDPYFKDCVDACVDFGEEPGYCEARCELFFGKLKRYLDKMEHEEHRHFYKTRAARCFRQAKDLNRVLGQLEVENCLKTVIRDAYKQTKGK